MKKSFLNENQKQQSESIIKENLFFTLDDIPGYYKEGFYYDIKSSFTGWEDDGKKNKNESFENDKNKKKIEKSGSLFADEIILHKKLIKKISFVSNFRISDTIKYYEKKKK